MYSTGVILTIEKLSNNLSIIFQIAFNTLRFLLAVIQNGYNL